MEEASNHGGGQTEKNGSLVDPSLLVVKRRLLTSLFKGLGLSMNGGYVSWKIRGGRGCALVTVGETRDRRAVGKRGRGQRGPQGS